MTMISVPVSEGNIQINPLQITHVTNYGDGINVHLVDGKSVYVDSAHQKSFEDQLRAFRV